MITAREKIAYGLGDTASNIIFQTVMLFLAFFYTDIFGLSPAAVGTMFIVVRLMDAITDPIMGWLADKVKTPQGQFRPFLVWLAVPFAGLSVLAFTTPDFSDTGKLIYAYITYALLMLAYTAINIPYCALGGVLTGDPKQRVSIQSYRFVLGMLGGLIVTMLTLPMVEFFGQGDRALGYQYTIAAMSAFGMLLFILCYAGTRERVPAPSEKSVGLRVCLNLLWRNQAFKQLALAAFFVLIAIAVKNTLAIYYVTYYLDRGDLVTWFITLGMIGNIVGCAVAFKLTQFIEKVTAYKALQIVAALLSIAAYWIGSGQLIAAFVVYFLWGFALQMATPLLWAKIADVVDYGEYRTGQRNTGLIYSAVIFFIKLGIAVGGALAGWWLAWVGYQADQVQSAEAQHGILVAFTVIPAVASILVAVSMRGYTLTEQRVAQIARFLARESTA
ncbi:glycoside-pentoside-hexuronide (GPH):cation symporter [Pseudidiomarina taiwanensis]|uniref:MFS transporter n=1 Tax=Pseudidiomarina taiwanensis TaxID=337250 RepID=A0A432ZP65_9GAMM|nr:glycoside-pentoside-hexuronide (GPH):cation symporter [Pseudidiomarina taiwanensis]RUO79677.1 MFS transporter [Pseudidiomarina taiwanensis]